MKGYLNMEQKTNPSGKTPDKNSDGTVNDNIRQVINELFTMFENDDGYISSDLLPDLDLYVDQITTFLSQHLEGTRRSGDDKVMTKAMINNYTKNRLLPPPEKKKYSKDHILLLIIIYYLKSFLSMDDIQTILAPVTDKYFHKDGGLTLEQIYTSLFSGNSVLADEVKRSVEEEYDLSMSVLENVPEEDRDNLSRFAFISTLSMDIFIKKQLIEHLLDK